MIDIKIIRENKKVVEDAIKKRNMNLDINEIVKLDKKYREENLELENLNCKKNKLVKDISTLVSQNKKDEITKIKEEVKKINDDILKLEEKSNSYKEQLDKLLLTIPNIPLEDVHYGKDENDNKEIRKFSNPTKFNFDPKSH